MDIVGHEHDAATSAHHSVVSITSLCYRAKCKTHIFSIYYSTTTSCVRVWSYACFADDNGRALFRNHVVTF